MPQIDLEKAKNVKRNIEFLLTETDLTWTALSDGCKISQPTLRRIYDLKTNLSTINEKKIQEFFGIPTGSLGSSNKIEIPIGDKVEPYQIFKSENKDTIKYFISKSLEFNVANFVRKQVLIDSFFENPKRKSHILERLKFSKEYKKEFSDSAMEKEIERLYKIDGILDVEDLHGNNSVFLYFRKK
jgi:hypothetical protein